MILIIKIRLVSFRFTGFYHSLFDVIVGNFNMKIVIHFVCLLKIIITYKLDEEVDLVGFNTD